MNRQTDAASAAAIAAFLAKKSATKVGVGINSGISDRQFFLASRGDIDLKTDTSEQRSERYMETVREAKHCGADDNEALWLGRMAGDMSR